MPAPHPEERRMAAASAAHTSWSRTPDPAVRTAPARAAQLRRFDDLVDPEGQLDPADRARRAAHARRAHYLRMQLRSVESRRRAAELLAVAEAAEAEMSDRGDAS